MVFALSVFAFIFFKYFALFFFLLRKFPLWKSVILCENLHSAPGIRARPHVEEAVCMGAGERIIIQTLELPQHNGKCALDMVMVLASFAAAHTQFSSLPFYENVFSLICICNLHSNTQKRLGAAFAEKLLLCLILVSRKLGEPSCCCSCSLNSQALHTYVVSI